MRMRRNKLGICSKGRSSFFLGDSRSSPLPRKRRLPPKIMKKRRMVVDQYRIDKKGRNLNEAWVYGVAIKVETLRVHGKLDTDMI